MACTGVKSRLHQQLDFTVIGESRDRPKQADRVGSGHQESAASDEGALELHVPTQQLGQILPPVRSRLRSMKYASRDPVDMAAKAAAVRGGFPSRS
jgi:hypothetical protein